ncbi:MAG TPA: tetratricopeptide repeat protein [Candidatus Acidoferrum sp.]|nr:tetratricopeptide repeat protein [Candidatus Acidoferrum sp.]
MHSVLWNSGEDTIDTGCIIIGVESSTLGAAGLAQQRYTQREVRRILGLEASRLRYWTRLQLVRPRSRWGERFYSFGDLVALRTIQRLTKNRVPAKRVQRAVSLIERQFGQVSLPLQELRLVEQGRHVVVVPPGASSPFDPLTQQWVFLFDGTQEQKLRPMSAQSAEELFQSAIDCESQTESLPQAIETYRRVIELSPNWVEAHINMGVALYQLGRIEEAQSAFRLAVQIDPMNSISRYNLGCVLEERGELDEAIEHLQRAARMMPAHPDVHFNLALAYDKRGERRLAREQWMLYLRYAPNGPWADQARARLRQYGRRRGNAPIPFPRKA